MNACLLNATTFQKRFIRVLTNSYFCPALKATLIEVDRFDYTSIMRLSYVVNLYIVLEIKPGMMFNPC